MGCDIHVLVEIKRSGKPWELWFKHPTEKEDEDENIHEIDCISGRSYAFFGILANVRDMVSNPIAADRGLPPGVCDYVKKWDDQRGLHSVTWCTLPEMELAVKRYNRELWERGTDDFGNMVSLLDHMKRMEYEQDPNQSVYASTNRYDRGYNTITALPIRRAYDLLVGEHLMLGIPKPRVRFIIGFDS